MFAPSEVASKPNMSGPTGGGGSPRPECLKTPHNGPIRLPKLEEGHRQSSKNGIAYHERELPKLEEYCEERNRHLTSRDGGTSRKIVVKCRITVFSVATIDTAGKRDAFTPPARARTRTCANARAHTQGTCVGMRIRKPPHHITQPNASKLISLS